MTINTTLDQGRLHVAYATHYQGSINSYNNFISRLTKHVGLSSDVIMDGKENCLNNKSYLKFLNTVGITDANLNNLNDYKNFDTLNIKPITNRGAMRSHLTSKTTQMLGNSLINAIQDGDEEKAKKLLGEGAAINQTFWIQEGNSGNVFTPKINLPIRKIEPFKATFSSPLLLAAAKNLAVAQDLLMFGADANFTGKSYTFSRDIAMVKNDYGLEPLTGLFPKGNYVYQNVVANAVLDGPNSHRDMVPGLRLDGVKKEITTFIDRITNGNTLRFDSSNGRLLATPSPELNSEKKWTHEGNIERIRIV